MQTEQESMSEAAKAGTVMFPSAEKNMFLTAALTAETAEGAETSSSRWTKG